MDQKSYNQIINLQRATAVLQKKNNEKGAEKASCQY